ncbi:hypothetical protein CW710_01715 [Candidatus Bathyarchaeota archaeon]|nr:hypothetical protein [Candidatus Bathyarchaeota archaeon]RJS74385.1 MAG: hypothetical protein CW710_01715 [Candidatus Bathyarchaeota archaeon]
MRSTGKALALLIMTLTFQTFTLSAIGDDVYNGWIKKGVYAKYVGNVTYVTQQGVLSSEGYMRWEIIQITTDNYAIVNMTLTVLKDEATSSTVIKIDLERNVIVEVDGRRVFNVTNYLWINFKPSIGQVYQLENLTARVVDVERRNLMGVEVECYVMNVTFKTANVTGSIKRAYDADTGVMVAAESYVRYLTVNGEVDHECHANIVLKESNIPRFQHSDGLPERFAKAISLLTLLMLMVYILSRRVL